ncbi:hypothetical protein COCMIDRAFT_81868 [Bipolaris oryzae ATCC 44560]|uniref:Uncharacterized protein n=1 Tax=Bipolaris oryzae ATCC 44560 TaxID=930090 RepID=W7A302_COCMI|nr:uncharacterized protein COCMIDRAFT_81868 [Bipolaris oryzae ATCC 44560]EUC50386.1 hypothetical protein COCMIDRAFT_81868 [Bipolaris oryzae ATCC 44560]
MAFPIDYTHKLPRYYANTLSKEDRHTLTYGEKNHNLKQWTGRDLVRHHESRRNLIPNVMPKVEKMNALADIEHGEQYSQRAMAATKAKVKDRALDKVRGILRIPRIKITTDKGKEQQESQSANAHRSTNSTPSLFPDNPVTSPSSPHHPRPSSSSDYFSHRPTHRASSSSHHNHHRRISPLALSSGPPSDSSVRVRSPLAHQVQFQPNPDITFDTFLAPHKSGKGEVLHEAAPDKKKCAGKRLSKMPSMPLLGRRGED